MVKRYWTKKRIKKLHKAFRFVALGVLLSMILTVLFVHMRIAWIIFYYEVIALLMVGLYFCVYLVISPWCHVDLKRVKKPFVIKHHKKVDAIMRVLAALIVLVIVPTRILPAVLDIPYAVGGDLAKDEVIALSASRGEDVLRHVDVMGRESGKEYRLHILSDVVEVGDHMRVVYLPHSKYGIAVKNRNGK